MATELEDLVQEDFDLELNSPKQELGFQRMADKLTFPVAKTVLSLTDHQEVEQVAQACFVRRNQLIRADPVFNSQREARIARRKATEIPLLNNLEHQTVARQLRTAQLAHPSLDDRTAQMHMLLNRVNRKLSKVRRWIGFILELDHPVYPWRLEDTMVVAILFNYQTLLDWIHHNHRARLPNNRKLLRELYSRWRIFELTQLKPKKVKRNRAPKIWKPTIYDKGIQHLVRLMGSDFINLIYHHKTFLELNEWPIIQHLLIEIYKSDLQTMELALRGAEVGNETLAGQLIGINSSVINCYFEFLDYLLAHDVFSAESRADIEWVPIDEGTWNLIGQLNPDFHARLINHPYTKIYQSLVDDPITVDRIRDHPGPAHARWLAKQPTMESLD